MRWNPPDRWVISKEPAHTALVSEADFIAVRKVHVVPTPPDGTTREYVLGGMIRCGLCGRKVGLALVNGWPGYRCRHGHNSSKQPDLDRPKTLYLREDRALAQLAELVASPCASTLAEVEAMLRSGELVVIAEAGSHPARSHRRSSLNAQNIISQALATPVRTSVSPKLVACVPSVPSIRANLTDTINQRPS